MSERKKEKKFVTNINRLYHGKKSLPSPKPKDSEDIPRYWYLDAKSHKERNEKLIELTDQWNKCFQVGKFNFTLIDNLRYWSTTPDRQTIELAISDTYRDTSKQATTYDSELNRICLPAHVPDCKFDKYDYVGINDDEECDYCFAYSKRDGVMHTPVVTSQSTDTDPLVKYNSQIDGTGSFDETHE